MVPANPWLLLSATLAAAAPTLLAYNVSPSATFLNQALALAPWGLWVMLSQPLRPALTDGWRPGAGAGPGPVLAALGLMALGVSASWAPGALPGSLALSALGLLAAATLLLLAGAGARRRADATALFAAFCWALAITGLLNTAVAAVQVFAPGWTDGDWLATSGYPGRAVGNLRQPNHLSSVLTWGCVAVVGLLQLRHLRLRWAAPWLALLVAAIVLTASRTGLVSVLLLALWGALDRRLQRGTRWLLLAAPLLYGLAWWAAAQWAAASDSTFGGAARLAETDISSSRFGIWANTLALIGQQPWAGVGWGEFNYAWTLTPFPGRPTAFFDHTHNLPLQLLVELGLPLGGLVLGLLLWGLWRAAAQAWARDAPRAGAVGALEAGAALATSQRCALMLVLMVGLHSLLEYPLWYAYFLLPTAWAWGFALQGPAVAAPLAPPARPSRALAAGAAALLLATGYAVADYRSVVAVFRASAGDAPLAQRIAAGQRSLFHAHHADYAAATAGVPMPDPETAFARATHFLLDTRLMMAWARHLADTGREDEARHLAQRLREFRKADAKAFFEACDRPPAARTAGTANAAAPAFPCAPPQADVPWRRFLAGR